MNQESSLPCVDDYTVTAFSFTSRARSRYEVLHAANNEGGYYRTLCGKLLDRDGFFCLSDEPHTITCATCAKALKH